MISAIFIYAIDCMFNAIVNRKRVVSVLSK